MPREPRSQAARASLARVSNYQPAASIAAPRITKRPAVQKTAMVSESGRPRRTRAESPFRQLRWADKMATVGLGPERHIIHSGSESMLNLRWFTAVFVVAFAGCSAGSPASPTPSVPAVTGPTSTLSAALSEFEAGKAHRLTAYVADDNSIKAFPVAANGNVSPTRALNGPATGLTAISDVAIDKQGALYVADGGAGAGSIRIFAHGASGNAAPIRVIAGPNTQIGFAYAVAVDTDGRIYVGEQDSPTTGPPVSGKLLRFAPNAAGNVAPEATLSAAVIRHIALDSTGKNLILSESTSGFSVSLENIATYPRRFSADSKPLYDIRGSGGDPIVDDPSNHSYYVVNPIGLPFVRMEIGRYDETAVSVFGPNPTPPPLLDDLIVSCNVRGLALDGSRELVTTGAVGAGCAQGAIAIFDPGANGRVDPIRTITGSLTTLVAPSAVAIGS